VNTQIDTLTDSSSQGRHKNDQTDDQARLTPARQGSPRSRKQQRVTIDNPNAHKKGKFFPVAQPKGQAHSEKKRLRRSLDVEIKNCDRNGPEGQFITDNTAMCNAGFPLYCAVLMSSAQSIKVSMKKKRGKERWKKLGEQRRLYRWFVGGPCTTGPT